MCALSYFAILPYGGLQMQKSLPTNTNAPKYFKMLKLLRNNISIYLCLILAIHLVVLMPRILLPLSFSHSLPFFLANNFLSCSFLFNAEMYSNIFIMFFLLFRLSISFFLFLFLPSQSFAKFE